MSTVISPVTQTAEVENGHHHPISDFDHDHDNDNKSDNEHCLLNRIIGLPTNAVRQICGCDIHADLHPDFGGFYAVLLFFQFEFVEPAVTCSEDFIHCTLLSCPARFHLLTSIVLIYNTIIERKVQACQNSRKCFQTGNTSKSVSILSSPQQCFISSIFSLGISIKS